MILTWRNEAEASEKIGMRVRMSPTGLNKWGNQSCGKGGKITEYLHCDSVHWVRVLWDNNESNSYRSGDLEKEEPKIQQTLLWEEEHVRKKG